MKGTFFQSPHEFNLIIEGETWRQGEIVQGSLTVRDRGNAPSAPRPPTRVLLAWGEFKKVLQKTPGAFEVLAESPLTFNGDTAQWKFTLDANCPITDKSGSLYVLCGKETATEKLGPLQLKVQPSALAQEFLKILQIHFRFVPKGEKAGKDCVEAKFDPPSAREFATLDRLLVQLKTEADDFKVRYQFEFKNIDASAGMKLTKNKKILELNLPPDAIRLPSGRFNFEKMTESIQSTLKSLNLGPLL